MLSRRKLLQLAGVTATAVALPTWWMGDYYHGKMASVMWGGSSLWLGQKPYTISFPRDTGLAKALFAPHGKWNHVTMWGMTDKDGFTATFYKNGEPIATERYRRDGSRVALTWRADYAKWQRDKKGLKVF